MTSAEARRLIGKRITWREYLGHGFVKNSTGIVEDVIRKNVLINGDWKWLPDLVGAKKLDAQGEA